MYKREQRKLTLLMACYEVFLGTIISKQINLQI